MRRGILACALLLCLPMVGEGQQGIRYHPDQSTNVSVGKPSSPAIRYYPPTSTLRVGLASCWKMSEANGDRSDSVGTNTLVDTNTVASTDGISGNGARFAAVTNEKLTVADNASLQSGGAFAIAFWARRSTTMTTSAGLVSRWSATVSSNTFLVYAASTTTVSGVVAVGGVQSVTSGALTLPLNTWTLFIFSKPAGASSATLYIGDGATTTATASVGAVNAGSVPLEFGVNTSTYNNIDIDEACYWPSRELTAAERSTLYNGGTGKFYPF